MAGKIEKTPSAFRQVSHQPSGISETGRRVCLLQLLPVAIPRQLELETLHCKGNRIPLKDEAQKAKSEIVTEIEVKQESTDGHSLSGERAPMLKSVPPSTCVPPHRQDWRQFNFLLDQTNILTVVSCPGEQPGCWQQPCCQEKKQTSMFGSGCQCQRTGCL